MAMDYDEASWDQILRVMRAADMLEREIAAQGNGAAAYLRQLKDAVAACPGTSAWHTKLAASQGYCVPTNRPKPEDKSCG